MMHIFCSIPNYSGSTLVHNLLAQSSTTLKLDAEVTEDFVEGNTISPNSYFHKSSQLYTTEMKSQLQLIDNYDWVKIKQDWHYHWSKNPGANTYIQKTPSDIFRVKMMSEQFENLKWIIMVKDPYAYIESLFKRYRKLNILSPYKELDKLCAHVILVMQTQLENIEILGDSAYTVTLEDFLNNKQYHVDQIEKFTDGLVKIDLSKQIWIKGKTSGEITNANEQKIQRLISMFPDIISKINEHFVPHEELLNKWGYSIRYE